MREDIIIKDSNGDPILDANGRMQVDFAKAIGKNYGKGFFLNCKARYRFYEGARSTKKSYNMIGYEPILKIMLCPLRNVLILRQNDVDNRQTTFEQICRAMDDLGVTESFQISKNPLVIEYKPTGQRIIFRGLNNPTSLNGINFSTGYFTDAYIDEAFEVSSYEDFRKLDGSMRGKLPEGYFFQITCCLNAWNSETWIYHEFFHTRLDDDYVKLDDPDVAYMDYYDPDFIGPYGKGLYLHKSTYKCNEFRSPDYDLAAMEMRAKSKDIYMVEFLGMWGNSTEAVYPEFNETLCHPMQWFNQIDMNGRNMMDYADFAIGIDTGLSNGQGGKRTIRRGENVATRIKSATTMQLVAITSDFRQMVVLDEYFHSNDKNHSYVNSDNREQMTEPQLVNKCIDTLLDWIERYGNQGSQHLMRGRIRVYVDGADIGFRQGLELRAREMRIYNAEFYGTTKQSVQSRVDFEKIMMGYGDMLICDRCKNLIREIKNARRGEKGEAREDNDDHCLTAMEYGFASMLPDLRRYKTFKVR